MKTRNKRIGVYNLEYQLVTFRDLLLLKSNVFKTRLRNFKSYNEYFSQALRSKKDWNFYAVKRFKVEQLGWVLASKILRMFFDLLMADLIDENDTFLIPHTKETLSLSVGHKDLSDKPFYRYNFETRGKNYDILLNYLGPGIFRRHYKIPYNVKLTQRFKEKLEERSKHFDYE